MPQRNVKAFFWIWTAGLGIGFLILAGCSTSHYREAADRQVYDIIEAKGEAVEDMPSDFTIEEPTEPIPAPGPDEATREITLREALELAVDYSRTYQSERESLFSQGLALTSARHEFDPIPFGIGSAEVEGGDGPDTVSGFLSFGINKMLATGADLSVSIATNFFRIISGGDPQELAASTFSASLVQPLLRGAGKKVALENLTQAERSMVYAVRDYARFRKTFSVDIAQSYFNLLEQRDRVENARVNFENLMDDRRRTQLLAEAARVAAFEVDQAEQDVLRAKDEYIRTIQSYQNALDVFKVDLGLPTDLLIEPATAELGNLPLYVGEPVDLSTDEAIEVALTHRMDLKNVEGGVEDARRKIIVAENALKAGLDLTLAYNADTETDTKPLKFSGGNDRYSAGLDVELPFDRLNERNAYRQSLINLDASQRDLSERIDRIKLEVRDQFRNLERARRSYDIQVESVQLAERRVESTVLLQQAGRATTRDVLESRAALLSARNQVTSALVDFFNARLDLLLAIEALRIDNEGFWMAEVGGEATDNEL